MGFDSRSAKKLKVMFKQQCRDASAVCWLCGQPINYDAPPNSRDAFEPDHFYPQSTHPELAEDPENLRPSHCSCNRSRKDGVPAPRLGSLSEQW